MEVRRLQPCVCLLGFGSARSPGAPRVDRLRWTSQTPRSASANPLRSQGSLELCFIGGPNKQGSLRSSGLGIFSMSYVLATWKLVIFVQCAEDTGEAACGLATLTPSAVPQTKGINERIFATWSDLFYRWKY